MRAKHAYILPCEAKRSGGGGPHEVRGRGRTASADDAPSTMLRMVPLPRFTGEDA